MADNLRKVQTLYPYSAQNSEELSFESDVILEILDKSDQIWWLAKKTNGEVGLVPSNYVDEIISLKDLKSLNTSTTSENEYADPTDFFFNKEQFLFNVWTKYSYVARNHDELSFDKNVVLQILEKPAKYPNWWRARNKNGDTGLIPSNYVEEIATTPTTNKANNAFSYDNNEKQNGYSTTIAEKENPNDASQPIVKGITLTTTRRSLSENQKQNGSLHQNGGQVETTDIINDYSQQMNGECAVYPGKYYDDDDDENEEFTNDYNKCSDPRKQDQYIDKSLRRDDAKKAVISPKGYAVETKTTSKQQHYHTSENNIKFDQVDSKHLNYGHSNHPKERPAGQASNQDGRHSNHLIGQPAGQASIQKVKHDRHTNHYTGQPDGLVSSHNAKHSRHSSYSIGQPLSQVPSHNDACDNYSSHSIGQSAGQSLSHNGKLGRYYSVDEISSYQTSSQHPVMPTQYNHYNGQNPKIESSQSSKVLPSSKYSNGSIAPPVTSISKSNILFLNELWYHGSVTREACERYLASVNTAGEYLVRDSESTLGDLSLSLRATSGIIKHYKITRNGPMYVMGHRKFRTMDELIRYYIKNPIFTDPNGQNIFLRNAVNKKALQNGISQR